MCNIPLQRTHWRDQHSKQCKAWQQEEAAKKEKPTQQEAGKKLLQATAEAAQKVQLTLDEVSQEPHSVSLQASCNIASSTNASPNLKSDDTKLEQIRDTAQCISQLTLSQTLQSEAAATTIHTISEKSTDQHRATAEHPQPGKRQESDNSKRSQCPHVCVDTSSDLDQHVRKVAVFNNKHALINGGDTCVDAIPAQAVNAGLQQEHGPFIATADDYLNELD